jgi:hypothetical protein
MTRIIKRSLAVANGDLVILSDIIQEEFEAEGHNNLPANTRLMATDIS